MKFFMFFLYVICCVFAGTAQDLSNEYADRISLSIPARETNTTTDIAAYINKNLSTDNQKVRAIYTWVAANIRYNTDSIHPVIFEEDRDLRIASALKRRKGVCENYASIFNDICLKSGLRSLIVEGYTRQNGSLDRTPHAWCTVCIDNNWSLYDPTWDEDMAFRGWFSQNINYYFYQALPKVFIQTHMPFDPMFQLLNYPITYNEFFKGNAGIDHNKPYFNYADSIYAYEKSNSLNKYLSSALRIENNGTPTKKVINKLNQLKMDIEIIYQDRDTSLYNLAVADYNNALANFNTFINYRNNQFSPAKPESEIQEMFNASNKAIAAAHLKLKEINQSKANFTLNTAPLEEVLNNLSLRIKEQQAFQKEYLSSAKAK